MHIYCYSMRNHNQDFDQKIALRNFIKIGRCKSRVKAEMKHGEVEVV